MRSNCRIDTYQFAICINQSTAAIAGIYCRIRLYKRLYFQFRIQYIYIACLGTHDTGRNRRGQVKRIAYCQNPLPHFQQIRISQRQNRQAIGINFQQRNIRRSINSHNFSLERSIVVQRNFYFRGIVYHMIVRYNIPVRRQNDSRTRRNTLLHSLFRHTESGLTEKEIKNRAARIALRCRFILCFDMHHTMHRAFGSIRKIRLNSFLYLLIVASKGGRQRKRFFAIISRIVIFKHYHCCNNTCQYNCQQAQ